MKPNDLYKLPPIAVHQHLYSISRCVEEVDLTDVDSENAAVKQRIQIRMYADHSFDGERCWDLSSVWLDDKPFMIVQCAGRAGGKDHSARFITDVDRFHKFVQFIQSLQSEPDNQDVVDPDKDIEHLTSFYGYDLADFYRENVKPKRKVGDIVHARVPENHLIWHGENKKVVARVRIDLIRPFSPRETYHGLQLDRRWDHKGIGPNKMVFDQDKGEVYADFCEADIVENT